MTLPIPVRLFLSRSWEGAFITLPRHRGISLGDAYWSYRLTLVIRRWFDED